MFYIYTPYVTPSGARVSNTKIVIYEAVASATYPGPQNRYTTTRRLELTRKGWKSVKDIRNMFTVTYNTVADASTTRLDGYALCFATFDEAYLAKCILINRIPEVFIAKLQVLTDKMNSLKPATPQPQFMSDAIPEVFV